MKQIRFILHRDRDRLNKENEKGLRKGRESGDN